MQAAAVPAALRAAVLAVHESCKYSVTHGTYRDTFELQVGVRQGCALSPLLYALYTAWLYEQIAAETSEQWASAFLTIFADDKHLAWEVNSVEELQFVCKCVQVTYRLLQQSGMQVNPEKSKVVVALRGSAAARWLRKHSQRTPEGTFLDLGTPHQPLHIQQVSQIVYLGVVASYSGFEMQTFKHRQKAAAQNRQRLLKLLHSRLLSQNQRVRLYRACVVSSLLYGLHAVGLTIPVQRLLEATDARALRALVRSPAHLYHEITNSSRVRLRIPSPSEMLQKLLRKRCLIETDDGLIAWFRVQLEALTGNREAVNSTPEVSLSPSGTPGVACPVCGIVCINRQHMLSHFARRHKTEYQEDQSHRQRTPQWYMQHAVNGMPQCRHCLKKFVRFEGFKKHLKQACPVLHSTTASGLPTNTEVPGCATGTEVEVASTREESHGQRGPTPQVHPAEDQASDAIAAILAEDPAFRALSSQSWQSVLRRPDFCKSLSTYCALCGQWAERTGFKQHIRLKHIKSLMLFTLELLPAALNLGS